MVHGSVFPLQQLVAHADYWIHFDLGLGIVRFYFFEVLGDFPYCGANVLLIVSESVLFELLIDANFTLLVIGALLEALLYFLFFLRFFGITLDVGHLLSKVTRLFYIYPRLKCSFRKYI